MVAGLHGFPVTLLKCLIEPADYILILIHGISVGGTFNPSRQSLLLGTSKFNYLDKIKLI